MTSPYPVIEANTWRLGIEPSSIEIAVATLDNLAFSNEEPGTIENILA